MEKQEKEKGLMSNIKNNYNSLTKKGKTILWVWIVILLIVSILIIVCNSNNKITSSHKKMEEAMAEAAKKYAEKKDLHGSKDQKIRIDLDELRDSKYLKKKDITDDTCRGYVSYYSITDKDNKEQTKIESYIKCKKYTTDGYKN